MITSANILHREFAYTLTWLRDRNGIVYLLTGGEAIEMLFNKIDGWWDCDSLIRYDVALIRL